MQFISVNFALNETYQVEKNVFVNLIKNKLKKIKNVKLIDLNIDLIKNKNNLIISIEIEINNKKKNKSLKETIISTKESIESAVFNLIETKPQNIEIIVKEHNDES